MCRAGGRRCPSHNNKLAIQARNAKRRSRYTAAKIESLKNDIQAAQNSGDEATAEKLSAQQPELFSKLFLEINESTELNKQYQESIAEESHDETTEDDGTDEQSKVNTVSVPVSADDDDAITVLNNSAIDDSGFSKMYHYAKSDINELTDGDLDDDEQDMIINDIRIIASSISADETASVAQHLSEKAPEVLDEEPSKLKALHQDLRELADTKRLDDGMSDVGIDDLGDVEDDESTDLSAHSEAPAETAEPVESPESRIKKSIEALPQVFKGKKYKGASGKNLFRDTDEVVSSNPELGIYKTKNEGELADKKYFNPETIRGKIVKSELNENSAHTDFGFREIEKGKKYQLEDFTQINGESKIAEISNVETSALTDLEQEGVRTYTGSMYRDINNTLYDVPDKKYANKKFVKRSVSQIDRALKKSPKRQRYLYRAVNAFSPMIKESGGNEGWVNRNFALGEDVVFDGYQSSTSEGSGCTNFASSNGVVFEILTSEGMNVTGTSNFASERETLLPRGARYKVVGINKGVEIASTEYTYSNNTVVRLVAVNEEGEVLDGSNADKVKPLR